mgnify:FL=1
MKQLLLRQSNSQKSQAVSELAILGTLIIAAFAAALSFVQSMNSQQALQMGAFRRAIQLSRQYDKEVSYTIVKDSPTIDVTDPFGRPDMSRQTVSCTVLAVKDDPLSYSADDINDRGSMEVYNVNGREIEVPPMKIEMKYTGKDDPIEAWVTAPIVDVGYQVQKQRQGLLSRIQGGVSISSTHSGSVNTRGVTNLVLEDKTKYENNYLENLNDEVEEEPWEKQLRVQGENEFYMSELFHWVGFGGLAIAQIFTDNLGGCGMSGAEIAKTAIIAGASFAAGKIYAHYINGKYAGLNTAESVTVSSGYRAMTSIPQAGSFSQPGQTLSVSQ